MKQGHFGPVIPSDELTLNDIPDQNSDLTEIYNFALTYDIDEQNPYIYDIDFDSMTAELSITQLRAYLYMSQRRSNNYSPPITDPIHQKLIAGMRKIVSILRKKLS